MKKQNISFSRRTFLKNSISAATGTMVFANIPTIVPASVIGKHAPSNRINIGAIGTGRISTTHDIPGVWNDDRANVIAVCDLDSNRAKQAKKLVDDHYSKKKGKTYDGVKTYGNYQELINNKDIDAVLISTPDHWHVLPAIHAVRAGKDVYMQKPASLTIAEGRILSNEVQKSGRIFQIGSQQRSMPQFKKACELVRNGKIGKVHTVYVGLPVDDPKQSTVEKEMPVPSNLNYDMWLGSTPGVFYTEKRVHPQDGGYSRPGWLRCEQFGAGMITGWGVHHFDIVNWGLDTEFTGPVEVSATAEFPPVGSLWDVHGPFKSEFSFANGVKVLASNDYPNGVKFVGSEGWIFVTRGNYSATASDPVSKSKSSKALDASDPRILTSEIAADGIHLYDSRDHHINWLDCIISRQKPITPIEVGHRACSVCLINHTSMKLKRKLYWDPQNERFKNDDEANTYLSRPQRPPYILA
ncbi:MAG: Gfo/Idh/MocA family oxidoreductase [Chitinophagaceae bacterium]|nr:Gfo/Idh/MocA family oxidoreductase [Chitinophagaceae bacterium]